MIVRCILTILLLCPLSPVRGAEVSASRRAVDRLQQHLQQPREERPSVAKQAFAEIPLTREDAAKAKQLLWDDFAQRLFEECQQELAAERIVMGNHTMPLFVERFGDKPVGERSLTISMHGGGGAPAALNDSQWENQKRLYRLEEGIYVAPRAPTNNWNLWHEPHIDQLFARLILDMVVVEGVDPDRVYLIGYSAGGDGVYQLAPRMADRWAGAAMMAGHPNETSPVGLRNTPFAIFVGGRDRGYHRNEVAVRWKEELEKLQRRDSEGYPHRVTIYPDKGHWMDRKDAEAIPWLSQFAREPFPRRIVWHQDDVLHADFYWLSVDPELAEENHEVVVQVEGNAIAIEKCDAPQLTLRFDDALLDLDHPVKVSAGTRVLWEGIAPRTIKTLDSTIARRHDPRLAAPATVTLKID